MDSSAYVLTKLTEAAHDLVACDDIARPLENAAAAIRFHRYTDLPQGPMESVIRLRLALGLKVPELEVSVPSPWPVSQLPRQRKIELGQQVISAVRDLAAAVEWKRLMKSEAVPFDVSRLDRSLAYSHLGWEGYGDCEPYLRFLQAAFPAFPEQVLAQWFQRHGRHGINNFCDFIRYERLRFETHTWSTEHIVEGTTASDTSYKDSSPESDGRLEVQRQAQYGDWLSTRMLEEGTWPVAPIFLADGGMAPRVTNAASGMPHLLEGHRRYSYLHQLRKLNTAQELHTVWVGYLDEEARSERQESN